MAGTARRTLVLAVVAFLAALAGVVIGRGLTEQAPGQSNELHEFLHDELDLDAGQLAKVHDLEAKFAVRREALENEMRADNARLASAINAEQGYGPRVTAEIERSHRVMGQLQKETLAHVFAMRAVLRPDQADKFDRAVVKALTSDAE